MLSDKGRAAQGVVGVEEGVKAEVGCEGGQVRDEG